MRLMLSILLALSGLGPAPGYAGTLVGEWYQEDPSGEARRAVSQPVSRSTDAIDVTLGIGRTGPRDGVEFFVLVSGADADAGCRYAVTEITVDSSAFPVSSTAHASTVAAIAAASDAAQQRLWREFRRGRSLSLRVESRCAARTATVSETHRFDFSLAGSSAAYRHVAGQQTVAARRPENATTPPPVTRSSAGADTAATGDAGRSAWSPLLFLLLLAVPIAVWFTRHFRSSPILAGDTPGGERLDPQLGDYAGAWRASGDGAGDAPPADDAAPLPGEPADIDDLPRFRVERVVDGDTVIAANDRARLRVRLDSIDCPEGDQPWGANAAAELARLIGGADVRLEKHGIDDQGRTLATLYRRDARASAWVNVNERLVALGQAWVMRRHYSHLPAHRQQRLDRLESEAISATAGLWALPDPVPPWEWRRAR